MPPTDPYIGDFSWLEGRWVSTDGERTTTETWKKDGARWVGSTVFAKNGETVSTEALEIVAVDGVATYVATPSDQARTPFTLVERGVNTVVFANPSHDFPKRIAYRRVGDALVATVSGGDKELVWKFVLR